MIEVAAYLGVESPNLNFSLTKYFTTAALAVAIVILIFAKTHFSRVAKYLNRFPGPPIAPLLGNAGLFMGDPSDIKLKLSECFQVYGRCFRFWKFQSPQLMVADHVVAEKVLSSAKIYEKADGLAAIKPYFGEGLVTAPGEKWQRDRRELTGGLKHNLFHGFLETFNKHSKEIIVNLEKQFDECKDEKNIFNHIGLGTLDMVCDAVIGGVSEIDGMTSLQAIDAMSTVVEGMRIRIFKPWLNLPGLWNMFGNGLNEAKFFEPFRRNVLNLIKKKMKRQRILTKKDSCGIEQNRKTFMDILISGETPRTSKDIYDHVFTILGAGTDTSASAINYTLYMLALNPECQAKVQEELDEIFPHGVLGSISLAQLNKMKFLEMCVRETLRLFPPVAMFSRKMPHDIELDEKLIIPKDCNVYFWPFEIHRDPSVYPDPEAFNPDRFLPEAVASRSPYSYLAFSAGVRNCMGQKYAMMEVKVVLAHILSKFSVTSSKAREDLKLVYGIVLEPVGGIPLSLSSRNNNICTQ